ncbi:hypothetical protein QQP08_022461 [Theobroma cacao]|nr:hypothetical protein QQP08_022461 [Theobroma cacao]
MVVLSEMSWVSVWGIGMRDLVLIQDFKQSKTTKVDSRVLSFPFCSNLFSGPFAWPYFPPLINPGNGPVSRTCRSVRGRLGCFRIGGRSSNQLAAYDVWIPLGLLTRSGGPRLAKQLSIFGSMASAFRPSIG